MPELVTETNNNKTMSINTIIMGAVSGLVPAILVDYHGYLKALEKDKSEKFNWKLAFARWGYGALSGAVVSAGYKGVIPGS